MRNPNEILKSLETLEDKKKQKRLFEELERYVLTLRPQPVWSLYPHATKIFGEWRVSRQSWLEENATIEYNKAYSLMLKLIADGMEFNEAHLNAGNAYPDLTGRQVRNLMADYYLEKPAND